MPVTNSHKIPKLTTHTMQNRIPTAANSPIKSLSFLYLFLCFSFIFLGFTTNTLFTLLQRHLLNKKKMTKKWKIDQQQNIFWALPRYHEINFRGILAMQIFTCNLPTCYSYCLYNFNLQIFLHSVLYW